MSQLARYWIFFVIVAVGLVLSWGQVGVKTQRTLASLPPMNLLSTESPCRPSEAPCAATSMDRAVVLGPARQGLAVRQTGIDRGAIERAEAALLNGALFTVWNDNELIPDGPTTRLMQDLAKVDVSAVCPRVYSACRSSFTSKVG